MQLSPSTVPSESNALAGIFPLGAPVAASEGPGLAEPAGFAELMAALAPAPAGAQVAAPGSSCSAAPRPAAGFVAVADLRAPVVEAHGEGEATEALEEADITGASATSEKSNVIPRRVAKRGDASYGEELPVEHAEVQEPRRSLHEPVVGLETMVVPQVAVAPVAVAAETLEEEPAELDTEEAPLDDEDSPREEVAEETTLPVTREMPKTAFVEVEPQPQAAISPLHSRRIETPTPAASSGPAVAPRALTVADAGKAEVAPRASQVEAMAGQGDARFSLLRAPSETTDTPAAATRLPVAEPDAAPVAPLGARAPQQTAASDSTQVSSTPRDPAALAQQVDAMVRQASVAQPLKVATPERGDAIVAAGAHATEADASEQMLPVGVVSAAAGTVAPEQAPQREAAARVVAPRVVAAYTPREKIAGARTAPQAERFSHTETSEISFLNTDDKALKDGASAVGIDVAKSSAAMPAISSPTSFTPAAPAAVAVLDGASMAMPESPEVSAPEAVSNAGQAVEVVLRAVDTAAEREQKVVKLEFSVGDADLSVRVELAADEVRTTFRTESPELRAALAQEWQAVTADSGEQGGVRLAPAVISDKEQAPSTSADANSQRHERHAARQEEAASSAQQAAARSLLRAGIAADAPAAPTPSFRALAPAGTAQRLHLFA